MGITEPGDPVIAHPGVGDHRRARLDVAGEEGMQRAGRGIRQDVHPAAPVPSWLPDLDGDADQDLLAFGPASAAAPSSPSTSSRARRSSTYVLCRTSTGSPGSVTPMYRAQPVQHRPRPSGTSRSPASCCPGLSAESPSFCTANVQQAAEPHRQRRPPAVEQPARRSPERVLLAASGRRTGTGQPATGLLPACSSPHFGHDPEPYQDHRQPSPSSQGEAGISREPALKLTRRASSAHGRARPSAEDRPRASA